MWEFTADHRLEESSVLCSQGSKHTLVQDPWKVTFLSEVVCGMENCEALGEEQLKQHLLRYFCMEASCSELFT